MLEKVRYIYHLTCAAHKQVDNHCIAPCPKPRLALVPFLNRWYPGLIININHGCNLADGEIPWD